MRQPTLLQHDRDDAARQAERTRIARELHDDLGGNLIAIKMALARLARVCRPTSPVWPARPGTSTSSSIAPSRRCIASRSACASPRSTWDWRARSYGRRTSSRDKPASP
ncbi:MAG: histidine kinase [Massilia sp.]